MTEQQNNDITPIEDDGIVPYADHDASACRGAGSSSLDIETEAGKQKVHMISLAQKYANGREAEPCIEFPLMRSRGGIVNEDAFKKKKEETAAAQPQLAAPGAEAPRKKAKASEFSICAEFENPADYPVCKQKMEEMVKRCQFILDEYKHAVGQPTYNPNVPGKFTIANPLEPKAGKLPNFWLKLERKFYMGCEDKTSFNIPFKPVKGQDPPPPISWELLTRVDMLFIPVMRVSRITVTGQGAFVKMTMVSAVVLEYKPLGSIVHQTRTAAKYADTYGAQLSAQISKLEGERKKLETVKANLVAANAANAEAAGSNDGSTFAGLAPTAPSPSTDVPAAAAAAHQETPQPQPIVPPPLSQPVPTPVPVSQAQPAQPLPVPVPQVQQQYASDPSAVLSQAPVNTYIPPQPQAQQSLQLPQQPLQLPQPQMTQVQLPNLQLPVLQQQYGQLPSI